MRGPDRGQVDLAGLLVQVVGDREILGAEVVADVGRLAVRMPLPGGQRRLRRDRERLRGPLVGQVLVPMAVLGPGRWRDGFEPEVAVEQLVEQLLVAPVLDQRHPQHAAQRLPVGQGAGAGRGAHGIERLGHRHADPVQAQQPHEPVHAAFHVALQYPPPRQAPGERAAALADRDGAGPGTD